MAAPILLQPFLTFAGDNENQGIFTLKDYFSPGGSQNLWIDKVGRIRVVEGYSKLNDTAITTNTGGAAAAFRWLCYYGKISSGSPQVLAAVQNNAATEYEYWYSTNFGQTWTFIADMGAIADGSTSDHAIIDDLLYVTTPGGASKTWSGTTWAAIGPGQGPTITPTDAAVAGLLSGKFQWRLRPITATGKKYASAASAVLNLSLSKGSLSWTADADTNVTGYELYRVRGVGKIFYYVDFINGRTTVAYTDNIADSVIVGNAALDQHGDFDISGFFFVEPHLGRAWWGRTAANPRRWYYADAGFPDSIYSGENYFDVGKGAQVDDVTVGATGDYYNSMIFWLERSVWRLSGTGQVQGVIRDWNLKKSDARVGTVHGRSVLRIPAGAKYFDEDGVIQQTDKVTLAYFTPFGDLRIFDGNNDTIISHMKHDSLLQMNYTFRHLIHGVVDSKRDLAIWFYPIGSGSADVENTMAVVWDYSSGYMFSWESQPFGASLSIPLGPQTIEAITANIGLVMVGQNAVATGGYVYQLWSGDALRDGSQIVAKWVTKPIYVGAEPGEVDMVRVKRPRFLDLLFAKDTSPATVTVDVLAYDAAVDATALISNTTTGGSRVRVPLQITASGRFYEERGLRLRISSSAVSDWILEGMVLGYQLMPPLWKP